MAVLSKPEILKHLKSGNIVITPFNLDNVSNSSYDVRLGKYFFRQNLIKLTQILNPFYEKSVRRIYEGVEEAIAVGEIKSKLNPFNGLKLNDKVILIAPNETVLAHTIEFIGGKNGTDDLPAITTEMRARSSFGRIGIAVCKDAGWGDIGYVNRWTMEITNFSNVVIPLPVGARVAQIIFHETTKVPKLDKYARKGKYQTSDSISEIKKNWKPEDMLPRLHKDRDLGHFSKFAK
ncbi:deoxycytidine triphosphate deaminase [Patescibacteria group bacterium]